MRPYLSWCSVSGGPLLASSMDQCSRCDMVMASRGQSPPVPPMLVSPPPADPVSDPPVSGVSSSDTVVREAVRAAGEKRGGTREEKTGLLLQTDTSYMQLLARKCTSPNVLFTFHDHTFSMIGNFKLTDLPLRSIYMFHQVPLYIFILGKGG